MNDRLTVEWLRSANCRSRCQTLQTYMRTVVVHIAGNGLKCINMCITKRALHYLWEWIRARVRWCHRSCDALAGIALRCRCRWTMATINVHIMHDLHLQPRLSAKRERIKKTQKLPTQTIDVLLTYTMARVQSTHTMLRITECDLIIKKKGLQHFKGPFGSFYSPLSA